AGVLLFPSDPRQRRRGSSFYLSVVRSPLPARRTSPVVQCAVGNGPRTTDKVVLSRRLSLKLLAPTVLVSVLLVVTCVLVALYLNQLHVNVAGDLRENFASMRAADDLETTVREFIHLLRGVHRNREKLAQQAATYYHNLRHDLLPKSKELANLDRE